MKAEALAIMTGLGVAWLAGGTVLLIWWWLGRHYDDEGVRMTTVFNLTGTPGQQQVIRDALAVCDFPHEKLLPSLKEEGKESIRVDWEDLSRYAASDGKGHDHVHDGEAVAHPVERFVDGRMRVLGLFYLPPYTRIVLDLSLVQQPRLAYEVFGAEYAHAVDYHYMTKEHRRAFVNMVHTQQLPPEHSVDDGVAFWLDGHQCSWFDVNVYRMWVGEAFMEAFVEAFMPSVPVTINLGHPVGPEDREPIRQMLVPEWYVAPEPPVVPEPFVEPVPEPTVEEEPVEEEPAPEKDKGKGKKPRDEGHNVFAANGGTTYHDVHAGISKDRTWDSAKGALEEGLRPCRICKPGR